MKEKSLDIICLMFSSLLVAFAVRFFFSEHSLTPGGITGLSILLSYLTNINVDLISLCISLPLLLISACIIGLKFGVKTLFVTLMIPCFLKIVPETHVVDSTLVASILGGVLVGCSIILALFRNCATGGTDTLAMLIRCIYSKIKLPVLIFVLDMSIVMSSWFISNDYKTSLYSAISLFIIMKTIKIGINTLKID